MLESQGSAALSTVPEPLRLMYDPPHSILRYDFYMCYLHACYVTIRRIVRHTVVCLFF